MIRTTNNQTLKIAVFFMAVIVMFMGGISVNGRTLSSDYHSKLSKLQNRTFSGNDLNGISCPEDITIYTDLNACSALISSGLEIADPNHIISSLSWILEGATTGSSASTGINQISTYVFNEGTTTVTYLGKTLNNDSFTCTFAVTVVDNESPHFEKPISNITVAALPGECGADVAWPKPVVIDNCASTAQTVVSCSHISPSWFQMGTTKVVYHLSDGVEINNVDYEFTVTVVDNEIPTFIAPEKITVYCGDPVPDAFVSLDDFIKAGGSASDNCGINNESFRFVSESRTKVNCPFAITRTYQVEDENGNIAEIEHNILVVDQELMLKSALATITAAQSGNWNNPATWIGGAVPASSDNVVIPSGITVTVISSEAINGVDIQSGGSLVISGTNTLQVSGNWNNNGTFNAGTDGTVEFTGTNNATISGTNTFKNLIISKGSLSTRLTITGNTSVSSGGGLTMNGGLVTIGTGASFSLNYNSALTIPATAGFDVTGGTLTTGNFSITNNGLIRISSGTANIGTNSGNSVHTQVDGAFIVSNGIVNIAGRLENTAGGTLTGAGVNSGITISGGTVTIATVGNGLSNVGSLNVTANGSFRFTGGTIIFENPSNAATELDLGIVGGAGIKDLSGGTFQFGNSSTPSNSVFTLSSQIPLGNISSSANADLILTNDLSFTGTLSLNPSTYIELNGHTLKQDINARGSFTFPIADDAGNPVPVIINITSGTVGANSYIEITTTSGKHPNSESDTDYLNQYWTIDLFGISNPVYSITASYQNSDIQGTESEIAAGVWNGTSWSKYNVANVSGNTISATGVNGTSVSITGITLAPPTATINNGASVAICNGASEAISTTITGDAPLSYLWSPVTGLSNPNIANPTASPTVTTNYTLTVTDGNGFTGTANITVVVNPLPTAGISGTNTVCQSDPQPQITFTGANGTAPYTFTYRINSGANQTVVSSGATATVNVPTTASGTFNYYLIRVEDNNGCSQNQSGTATITVNSLPTASVNGTTSVCQNEPQPQITFTGAGGSAPYTFTYRINSGSNQTVVSSGNSATVTVPTGTSGTFNYNLVSVQDNKGCSQIQTGTASVTVNPLPTATVSGTATVCLNDTRPQVLFTGATGSAPYIFTYRINGGGVQTINSTGNTAIINAPTTSVGTFNYNLISVQDSKGCSQNQTGTATIEVEPHHSLTISSAAGTDNQTICINNAIANITYLVGGGANNASITAGSLPAGLNTNYSGGVFTISGTPTQAGIFNYTVTTSGNACTTASANGTIEVLEDLTIPVVSSAQTICYNSSPTVLSATVVSGGKGPIVYQWQSSNNGTNGWTNIVGQTSRNYSPAALTSTIYYRIEATDNGNPSCGSVLSNPVAINVTPLLGGSVTISPIDCKGASTSIQITATGGTSPYSYSFNGATNTTGSFTAYAGTNYSYVITDANGCTYNSAAFSITEPNELTASTTPTHVDCNGDASGAIDLQVSGGTPNYSYVWNNGAGSSEDPSGLVAGTYAVAITDANGCTATATETITEPTKVVASVNQTSIDCSGGNSSVQIIASGGTPTYQYSVDGGTNYQPGNSFSLSAGSYTVRVRDSKGCVSDDVPLTITEPAPLVATADPVAPICEGETLNLTASATGGTAPLRYSWAGPGGYSVNNTQNPGIASATPANSGNYTLTVTDKNGCTDQSITSATVYATPTMNMVADIADCHNSTISAINFSGANTYSWTNDDTSIGLGASGTGNIPSFTATNTTNAPVTATITVTPEENGCYGTPETFTITVNPIPVATATPQSSVYCRNTTTNISLSSDVAGTTFTWTANLISGSVGGYSNGSGSEIVQDLTNEGSHNNGGIVEYTITPTANGCVGAPITAQVELVRRNINRALTVTEISSGSPYCPGETIRYDLESRNGNNYWMRFSWEIDNPNVSAVTSGGPLNNDKRDGRDVFGSFQITTMNSTSVPQIANIVITASAYRQNNNNFLCEVASETRTITVNPFLLECPGDITTTTDAGACTATLSPSATLSCYDIADLSYRINGGSSVAGNVTNYAFPVGTTTVEYTANDGNGHSASCSFDVTVIDDVAPTINCPADITVNNDAGVCGANVTYALPTTNDDCPVTLTLTSGIGSGNLFPIGTTTETYVVTDGSGNSATCSFNVTVNDTEAPTVNTCPNPAAVCAPANGSYVHTDASWDATFDDNCGVNSVNYALSVGGVSSGSGTSLKNVTFPVGTTLVEWTATDDAGNTSAVCSYNVVVNEEPTVVIDQANPSVCLNHDITLSTTVSGTPNFNYQWRFNGGNISGETGSQLTLTNVQTSDAGNYDVVVTSVLCGTSTTSAPVSLAVSSPIVITKEPVDQSDCYGESIRFEVAATGGEGTYSYAWQMRDNESSSWVSIGGNQDNLLVSDIGNTVPDQSQYRVTVTDGCTNSITSAIATITVNDIIIPLFNSVALCQGDATTFTVSTLGTTPSSYQWYLDGSPIANDTHYSGALSQTLTVTNSQAIHDGTYSVKAIFDLTQPNNNGSNSCETFPVDVGEIIVDVTPPVAICQDITVQLDETGNVSITPEQVDNGSSDNCGTVTLSLDISNFDCTNIGANTVTLTVTDDGGNTATCTSTVTVEDNINPGALCQDITVELDASGSASIVAADIDNGSGDNCGTFTLAASTTTFDCSNVGSNTVTLSVTDQNGGVETCTSTVTVEDNIAPAAVCKDITVALDAGGNATVTAADIDNGSSDNCGIATSVLDITSFDCTNVGTNSVVLTITDVNGNSDNCTATVTVEDTENPVAVCQDITVQLDASGNATITTADIDNGSSDNCGVPTLSIDNSAFDCTDLGANTVTLTATDAYANTANCTATVTVEDNINVSAICQDVTVQLDATGNASITTADIDNGSSDNCGIASMSLDVTDFDCSNLGTNSVVLSITDNGGSTATCNATVTVEDNIVPTAVCKDITVALDATGVATITAADIDNGSSDNCGISTSVLDITSFDCSNVGTNSVVLTISDANGNSDNCTATVTVEDNVAPLAVCQDITVQLDVSGNATITTADIDNGSSDNCGVPTLALDISTFDCTDLGANTVTLTATDGATNTNSCAATVTVADDTNPVTITASVSQSTINCFGENATVTISSTGGVGTLTYTFDGTSNATGIFTNVPAGANYNWSVTNPLGCGDVSGTFDVVQPDELSATIASTDVTCASNNDGKITISAPLGGSGSYEFSVDGGASWQTNPVFTGLVPATYNVQMRDANSTSCIVVLDANVVVYSLTADHAFTHVTCFNADDGTITISNPHGGSNNFEYSIDGGTSWVSSGTFSNLTPGFYDVRIRDANDISCELTLDAALEITQPNALAADVTSSGVTCNGNNDGTITVSNSTGGYGTYEYTVNGGAGWQASGNFASLAPGSYDVRVRDAAQPTCELVLDGALSITEPEIPNVANPGNQILCENETTNAVVFTGTVSGTTFKWTNDSPSIGMAASGTGDIAAFVASNSTTAAITATITVTPEINNGGTTCYGPSESFTITVNPNPDVIATPASETICDGEATSIALTSNFVGTSFSWTVVESGVTGASDGSGTDIIQTLNTTSASAGTATYTITPTIGTCNGTPIIVTVTVNPLPTAILSGSTTICVGSSADLSVALTGEQPWSITYTDGTTPLTVTGITTSPYTLTLSPSVTTNYQLTAISDNNCTGTSFTGNAMVTVDQLPVATAGGSQTICANSSATVSGASAANGDILWTHDGAGTITDETSLTPTYTADLSDAGTTVIVTMTVTSNNACTVAAPATATYTINVDPLPTALAGGSETICFDGSATVSGASASNGTILWSHDGTGTLTDETTLTPTYTAGAGDADNTVTLTMTVTSDNGCSPQTATAQFTVIVYPEPQVDQPADQEICTGSTTTMINFSTSNVTGTTTYTWTNSTPSIGLAASGTGNIIPFTGTNGGNQPDTATIVVTPHLTTGGATCDGPPKTFTIIVNPVPVAVAPIGLIYCDGLLSDPYVLTGTPTGVVFDITGGASIGLADLTGVTEIPAFTPTAGNATLTMTPRAYGCSGFPVSFKVSVRPTPTATISGGATVCQNSAPPSISIGNPMTLAVFVTYSINGTDTYTVNVPGNSNVTIAVPTNIPGSFTYALESVEYLSSNPPTCVNTDVSGTAIMDVVAQPLPNISGPTGICAESTVNTYTTEAGMQNYNWVISAGGTVTAGGTSTDNSVTIVWNTGGAQNVSVSYANSNSCAAPTPTIFPVNVYPLPIPTITGSTSACEGVTGKVYSTQPGMTNYQWVISAGATVTAGGTTNDNSVTVTWDAAGPQTISVNYIDANGCEALSPTVKNITVNPLPVPTLSGPNLLCAGSTDYVYTTDPGMTGYSWAVSSGGTIVAGGNSTSNTATIHWNTGGSQTISVNYNNANGCSSASPTVYPVSVDSMPVPTITGETDVCVGETGKTYTTEAGMADYDWVVSAGGSITAGGGVGDNSVTIDWNTTGPQTVSVNYTNANNCSAMSPTVSNVTVHALPVPAVAGPQSTCVGSTGNTYTTVAGMSNYQWTIPAGGTITSGGTLSDNTVTVTWDTEGPKTISLNYSNLNGCEATVATDYLIDVYALPTPTITGPTDGCTGIAGVEYKTEHSMIGYVWRVTGGSIVSGGSANDSTATVVWNTPGSQTIEVNYYNPNNCTAENATVLVVNVIAPSPPNCPADMVVCSADPVFNLTGALPTGGEYTGAGVTLNGTDYEFDPAAAGVGTHTINYTMPNLCRDNCSFTITVNETPIGSASNVTICSGESANVALNSTVPGTTFSWTVSNNSAVTGKGSGTGEVITDTLYNTNVYYPGGSASSETVTYTVTASSNGCDYTFTVDVTVRPQLVKYDLTWNSNFAEPIIEVCAGAEALSDNDIEILDPTSACLILSSQLGLLNNVQFLYGPTPEGPWTSANNTVGGWTQGYTSRSGCPRGYYDQFEVDLALNNEIGNHYFVLEYTYNGCVQHSNPATLIVASNIIVEAGDPIYLCGGSTVQLTGAYVGGLSSGTITGRWSASSGTFSNTNSTTNPAGVTYTPPVGFEGEITLTLTTNDPDGSGGCVAIEDTRTVTIVPPTSFNGCHELAAWPVSGSNSDGYRDDSQEPCLVKLVGSNNLSGTAGNTDITHCSGAGEVSFDWTFLAPANKVVWHQEDQKEGGNSGSSTMRVDRPSNVSAGDLIVVTIHIGDNNLSFTRPSGFQVIEITTHNSYRATVASFYKIATASEPATYSFGVNGGSVDSNDKIYASRVTGHDVSNPIGGTSETTKDIASGGGQGYRTIDLTGFSASANSMLVAAVSFEIIGDNAIEFANAPLGMTTVYYDDMETSSRVATEIVSGSNTGDKSFQWPSYNSRNRDEIFAAAQMFTIRPASNELDEAYYLVDGTPTLLSRTNGESGSVSVNVTSGSSVGFRVRTNTNTGGPGQLIIYNVVIPNDTPVLTGTDSLFINDCQNDAFLPTFEEPVPVDDCGTATIQTGYPITDPVIINGCRRTQNRTWVFVDDCGAESAPFTQTAVWMGLVPLSVTCPVDPVLEPCTSDANITTAYNNWLAGFTATGGCNIQTNILTVPPLILSNIACGDTLNFTYTATDECGQSESCTSTFTVKPVDTLDVTCPADPLLPTCSDQATIQAAYNAWVAGFTVNGGCATVSDNIASIPALPDLTCGGQIEFIYIASNTCGQSASCISTFTVEAPPELTINVPAGVSLPVCPDSAFIRSEYENWKAGFTTTGGCSVVTNIVEIPAFDSVLCGGSISFTFTAENGLTACANSLQGTSTFSVAEAPPLIVNCPTDPNIEGCLGIQAITDAYDTWVDGFTVSGGCNVVTNINDIPPLGGMVCNGQISFTYQVDNGGGSCAEHIECTSTFTIGAAEPLTVTVPADTTARGCSTDQDIIDAFNAWKSGFGYSGGCDVSASDISVYSIPSSCGGTVTVIYTATDNCGQMVTDSASFTLFPEFLTSSSPNDEIQAACQTQTQIDSAFAVWIGKFGYSGGCGAVANDLSSITAPNACGGTVVVNYTVSDICGQVTNNSSVFTIDAPSNVLQEPSFTVPADMTLYRDDLCSYDADPNTVTGVPSNLADNCTAAGNLTMSFTDSIAAGACSSEIIIFRRWTVTDNCLNETSQIQLITVTDSTAPVIICATDVTGVADNAECQTSGVDLGTTNATDNCVLASLVGVRDDGFALNDPFPVGTTRITWTATDACGNSSICVQLVTMFDSNEPPTITCPADVVQSAGPNNCSLNNVSISDPIADDNCEVASITYVTSGATVLTSPATGMNYVGGETFNVGVTTVNYTAADSAGNTASCSFTVTILDETPPVITSGCTDVTESADPDNCSKVPGIPNLVYDDTCWPTDSLTLTYEITGATTGSGAGSVAGLSFNVGVSQVTYTVTDPDGNVVTCSFTVTILDVTPPSIDLNGCKDVSDTTNVNNCDVSPANIDDPIFSDTCWPLDSLTLTWEMTGATVGSGTGSVKGELFNSGITTVTYSVADPDNNTSTCSFTVTITPFNSPQFTSGCPPDVTASADPGVCEANLTIPVPQVDDPCSLGYTIVNDQTGTDNASGTYPVGVTQVVWTITPALGDPSSCTQIITVTDDENPVISTCPVTLNYLDCSTDVIAGPAFSTIIANSSYAEFSDATNQGVATDNCGIDSVNYVDVASGSCPITITRTWTLFDAAGNSATCDQTILINDTTPPVVDCLDNDTIPSDFNLPYAEYSLPSFGYSDNCTDSVNIGITWTISGVTNDSGTGLIPTPYRFNSGLNTISYIFTDECGNPTPCEFTLYVFFPPDINCLPAQNYTTDPDVCTHRLPTDANNPGVPTNSTGENIGWEYTIFNPDGSTGATGTSSGVSPQVIDPYDFWLGESTIQWVGINASGTDTCSQLITVVDNQPPTFLADPFDDCVELLFHAIYTGNADAIDYNPDYPNGDYKLFAMGDTYLDIDLNTYSDNCCTLADSYSIRWEIDFDGTDPSEPSISGTGQPSTYINQVTGFAQDIYLWGDGVNFQSRVHTITYWMTDCNGNESLPVTADITIRPRPELIKTTN